MEPTHNLGHNFAKAFDIQYLSADGIREYVATTSWGSSTRMLGGVIMTHGDDLGLRLPPALPPPRVVLIPLAGGEVATVAEKLGEELRADGVRVHLDGRFDHLSFGRRSVDWELKGGAGRVQRGAVSPALPVRVAGLRDGVGRGHGGDHPGDPGRADARPALPGRRGRGRV